MNAFDKFILENFAKYCDKHDIDVTDHIQLRLAGSTYVHEIEVQIINFIEWSIEDDHNNNTNGSAAVTATEGSAHD